MRGCVFNVSSGRCAASRRASWLSEYIGHFGVEAEVAGRRLTFGVPGRSGRMGWVVSRLGPHTRIRQL
jgi:hypothetical protein